MLRRLRPRAGRASTRFGLAVAFALFGVLAAHAPRPAAAACRVLEVEFTPSEGLQLVVWLEDASGTFVETLFITAATGSYGLGNRPGILDFNSEWMWPYGRRESVFPVWAHERGVTYPMLVFQDSDDRNLSHSIAHSSLDPYYCRPLREGEVTWNRSVDAGTCATPAFTDKGMFAPGGLTSLYPPRSDLAPTAMIDHADVARFAVLNDLDAVSQATPSPGMPHVIRWALPDELPDGEYVALVEASREFDQNESYAYPSPVGIPWSEYGEPYRGQPSVVWRVPFSVTREGATAHVLEYAGYGDPDGLSGTLFSPDATITSDVEGSGAGRLLVANGPEGAYRLLVTTRPSADDTPPAAPGALAAGEVLHDRAAFSFAAPGDAEGAVVQYEVRYLAGAPLTVENFTDGTLAAQGMPVLEPGALQEFMLEGLSPDTRYWVGVRAADSCLNPGPPAILSVATARVPVMEVDGCFVATAAWGSPLALEVAGLRRFRDRFLRNQAIGELFVESYYTLGPGLAAVVAPSEALRTLARRALAPWVDFARALEGR